MINLTVQKVFSKIIVFTGFVALVAIASGANIKFKSDQSGDKSSNSELSPILLDRSICDKNDKWIRELLNLDKNERNDCNYKSNKGGIQ